MLEVMKAEFEKWHRFPVTDDMDIQTEVAWMNWKMAWNAAAESCAKECESFIGETQNRFANAAFSQCADAIRHNTVPNAEVTSRPTQRADD